MKGDHPNRSWRSALEDAPPSMNTEDGSAREPEE
jgi:hypothetical protein